jgi:hypothetical protein
MEKVLISSVMAVDTMVIGLMTTRTETASLFTLMVINIKVNSKKEKNLEMASITIRMEIDMKVKNMQN